MQGDPLSPLVFVLVIEYLLRLFSKVGKNQGFKLHPYYKKSKLVHLMFVDDLIVFSAIDPRTVKYLVDSFRKFSKGTGLVANKDKSQIVIGGYKKEHRQLIL